MFTGIIEALGTIQAIEHKGEDVRLTVNAGKLDMSDVRIGDSISTNGVCLTVVAMTSSSYSVDVSLETLRVTSFNGLQPGAPVNLEKAMLANSRFDGHIVSGHVDGLGEVVSVENLGRSFEYWIQAPAELAKYIAHKGSITVDGVSLTVNEVDGARFKITIIPHTVQETIIGTYGQGSKVNLEVDVVARYLERLMLGEKAAQSTQSESQGISMEFLAKSGFLN